MDPHSFSTPVHSQVSSSSAMQDSHNAAEEALVLEGGAASLADVEHYFVDKNRRSARKSYVLPTVIAAFVGILVFGLSWAALARSRQTPGEDRGRSLEHGERDGYRYTIRGKGARTAEGAGASEQKNVVDNLPVPTGTDLRADLMVPEAYPDLSGVINSQTFSQPPHDRQNGDSFMQQLVDEPLMNMEAAWKLPGLEEFEASLSQQAQAGKAFLAKVLKDVDAATCPQDPDALHALAILAKAISGGVTDQLLGLEIQLINVKPVFSIYLDDPRTVKVTDLLGSGASNAVVEVVDTTTNECFAMRILYRPVMEDDDDVHLIGALGLQASADELEVMQAACGRTPLLFAASDRGIAVAQYTAEIRSMANCTLFENMFVFSHVQLMERLHGDLGFLLDGISIVPIEAKKYIAGRLLLEVLHLQKAGVSHNDLKPENCFMRRNGSFLLGDFGSSTMFASPRRSHFTEGTPAYAEPNMLLARKENEPTSTLYVTDPKSDMWSLGTILYELFMNGILPYDAQNSRSSIDAMEQRARYLLARDGRPKSLIPHMETVGVPARWQELICRLLEPKRERRIEAKDVVHHFADLYGGEPEPPHAS